MTFLGLHGHGSLKTQLVAAWDVFALTNVVVACIVFSVRDPYEVRRSVGEQDHSRTLLFAVIVVAAVASLFAVLALLASSKTLPPGELAGYIVLSVAAIVLSWLLVHTLFCLHYAHVYYTGAHKFERDETTGGLIFPGHGSPDYLDFAYFSFVIGMTCQVSDVQISSKAMRRLAMVHGLISFAFNTAILALFVNIIAGLI